MAGIFSRRNFLRTGAVTLGAAALLAGNGFISRLEKKKPSAEDEDETSPVPAQGRKFFNPRQYALVAAIASLIVPTDTEPGAAEAKAADYIEALAARSRAKQKLYSAGLKWLDEFSRKRYEKDFLALETSEQIELLELIPDLKIKKLLPDYRDFALNRIRRTWSDLFGAGKGAKFFRAIRADVFFAFYSNPISWRFLGYYGPPQPMGYIDYANAPSTASYAHTVRPIGQHSCRNCHEPEMTAGLAKPVSHKFLIAGESHE
jgi:hypothetical protein